MTPLSKPVFPPGVDAGEPILIVPTGMRLGWVQVPATDEQGAPVEEGAMAVRLGFDTVVGTINIATARDAAVELCKGLAQLLGLSEPSSVHVARSFDERTLGNGRGAFGSY